MSTKLTRPIGFLSAPRRDLIRNVPTDSHIQNYERLVLYRHCQTTENGSSKLISSNVLTSDYFANFLGINATFKSQPKAVAARAIVSNDNEI